MKKIIYTITKLGKKEYTKTKGIGYITDTDDLISACVSAKGMPYVRVFEGATKNCHPVPNKTNEFKGAFSEIVEVELTDDKDRNTLREVEVDYLIWYKLV